MKVRSICILLRLYILNVKYCDSVTFCLTNTLAEKYCPQLCHTMQEMCCHFLEVG